MPSMATQILAWSKDLYEFTFLVSFRDFVKFLFCLRKIWFSNQLCFLSHEYVPDMSIQALLLILASLLIKKLESGRFSFNPKH